MQAAGGGRKNSKSSVRAIMPYMQQRKLAGGNPFSNVATKRPLPRPQKKGLTFAALSGWGDKTATMTIIYRRLAQNFAMPAIAARLS
jgi:hypothetical protein